MTNSPFLVCIYLFYLFFWTEQLPKRHIKSFKDREVSRRSILYSVSFSFSFSSLKICLWCQIPSPARGRSMPRSYVQQEGSACKIPTKTMTSCWAKEILTHYHLWNPVNYYQKSTWSLWKCNIPHELVIRTAGWVSVSSPTMIFSQKSHLKCNKAWLWPPGPFSHHLCADGVTAVEDLCSGYL